MYIYFETYESYTQTLGIEWESQKYVAYNIQIQ